LDLVDHGMAARVAGLALDQPHVDRIGLFHAQHEIWLDHTTSPQRKGEWVRKLHTRWMIGTETREESFDLALKRVAALVGSLVHCDPP
jgi:hypothetical protein